MGALQRWLTWIRAVTAEAVWPARCSVCGVAGAWLCAGCRSAVAAAMDPQPATVPGAGLTTAGGPYAGALRVAVVSLKYRSRGHPACVADVAGVLGLTCARGRALGLVAATRRDAPGPTQPSVRAAPPSVRPTWPPGPNLSVRMRRTQHADPADALVPIPGHPDRVATRGVDHAAVIAEAAAGQLGVPCLPHLLRRARLTEPQVGGDVEKRRHNVAGAFTPGACRDLWVIVVDDVLTTGATSAEAVRVLKAAGARRVDVAVAARADRRGYNPRTTSPTRRRGRES